MNFFNKKHDEKAVLRNTSGAALLGLYLSGVAVVFTLAYYLFSEIISWPLAVYVLTVAVVVIYSYAVDFGVSKFMPHSLRLILRGDFKNGWKTFFYTIGMTALSFGLLGISTMLSVEGRKDVTTVVMEKPALQDVAKVQSQISASNERKIADLNKDIAEKRKAIAAAENSVLAQNSRLKQLVEQGNGWAKQKVERLKVQKSAPIRAELAALEKTKLALLDPTNEGRIIESVADQNKQKIDLYQEKIGKATS